MVVPFCCKYIAWLSNICFVFVYMLIQFVAFGIVFVKVMYPSTLRFRIDVSLVKKWLTYTYTFHLINLVHIYPLYDILILGRFKMFDTNTNLSTYNFYCNCIRQSSIPICMTFLFWGCFKMFDTNKIMLEYTFI